MKRCWLTDYMEYLVTTFYKFTSFNKDQLFSIKQNLEKKAKELNIIGLVLIAPEGINATLSGRRSEVKQYKQVVSEMVGNVLFKDSYSKVRPFKRFKVKIKPEIVQLQRVDLRPQGNETHISPQAWDTMIEKEDVVLIDVRNWYEAKLGTFKKALNPQTRRFSQFPTWLERSGISKNKKIGIFCTAGIRCEKAAVVMKEQGYENVYQLEGGILNYLEQRPNQNFEGECFVFDHRAAVGQDLHSSQRYGVCPQCGNGGAIPKTCVVCAAAYRTCEDCVVSQPVSVCSKNCRYKYNYASKKSEHA